jgi:uridine phosphorylase
MPPAKLGDFVVAEGAVRGDGASLTYAPLGYPAVADFALVAALRAELKRRAAPWRAGLFGTYDGFYTQMFSLSEGQAQPVESLRRDVQRLGLIATDMETATLLVAGRTLGAEVASLCLATVDGLTQAKIDAAALASGERDMFEIALDAIIAPRDGESS